MDQTAADKHGNECRCTPCGEYWEGTRQVHPDDEEGYRAALDAAFALTSRY